MQKQIIHSELRNRAESKKATSNIEDLIKSAQKLPSIDISMESSPGLKDQQKQNESSKKNSKNVKFAELKGGLSSSSSGHKQQFLKIELITSEKAKSPQQQNGPSMSLTSSFSHSLSVSRKNSNPNQIEYLSTKNPKNNRYLKIQSQHFMTSHGTKVEQPLMRYNDVRKRSASFTDVKTSQLQEDQSKLIMENLNKNMMDIQRNTHKIRKYHNEKQNSDQDEQSSIGSIVGPFEISTKLMLSKDMNNYFEVEEILDNVLEKMKQDGEVTIFDEKSYKNKFISCLKGLCKKLKNIKISKCWGGKRRTGKELWMIAKTHFIVKKQQNELRENLLRFLDQQKKHEHEIEKSKEILIKSSMRKEKQVEENIIDVENQSKVGQGFIVILQHLKQKVLQNYQKLLIHPSNRRLQYFHMVVALVLFFDTFVTGVTFSNQMHPNAKDTGINETQAYVLIGIIQVADIALNFLKIQITPTSMIDTPSELFLDYMTPGGFFMDIVSAIPYSLLGPQMQSYIFLRFLKLFEFAKYLSYFTEFVLSFASSMINTEQSKIFQSLFKLLFQIFIISHMCACLWILIGEAQFENILDWNDVGRGWIYKLQQQNIMNHDYWSKYITAFYWVITTFSSIGYGEVTGDTKTEYIYTMFVEMLGMCFFGYIIGLFQNILTMIGNNSNGLAEQEDAISYWLMLMDKAVNHHSLNDYNIQAGVRQYFGNKFKYDARPFIDSEIQEKLTPKMQKTILDIGFTRFYKKFEIIFRGCSDSFKREVFKNCYFMQFVQHQPKSETDQQVKFSFQEHNESPCIIAAQEMSVGVFFIIHGQINVMDITGKIKYTTLHDESFFGEMSLLLQEPNQYGYFYDPYDKPVTVLFIKQKDFMKICRENAGDALFFKHIALKRKKQFEYFKNRCLLSFMSTLVKNENIIYRKVQEQKLQISSEKWYNIKNQITLGVHLMRLFQIQYHTFMLTNELKKGQNEKIHCKCQKYISRLSHLIDKELLDKLKETELKKITKESQIYELASDKEKEYEVMGDAYKDRAKSAVVSTRADLMQINKINNVNINSQNSQPLEKMKVEVGKIQEANILDESSVEEYQQTTSKDLPTQLTTSKDLPTYYNINTSSSIMKVEEESKEHTQMSDEMQLKEEPVTLQFNKNSEKKKQYKFDIIKQQEQNAAQVTLAVNSVRVKEVRSTKQNFRAVAPENQKIFLKDPELIINPLKEQFQEEQNAQSSIQTINQSSNNTQSQDDSQFVLLSKRPSKKKKVVPNNHPLQKAKQLNNYMQNAFKPSQKQDLSKTPSQFFFEGGTPQNIDDGSLFNRSNSVPKSKINKTAKVQKSKQNVPENESREVSSGSLNSEVNIPSSQSNQFSNEVIEQFNDIQQVKGVQANIDKEVKQTMRKYFEMARLVKECNGNMIVSKKRKTEDLEFDNDKDSQCNSIKSYQSSLDSIQVESNDEHQPISQPTDVQEQNFMQVDMMNNVIEEYINYKSINRLLDQQLQRKDNDNGESSVLRPEQIDSVIKARKTYKAANDQDFSDSEIDETVKHKHLQQILDFEYLNEDNLSCDLYAQSMRRQILANHSFKSLHKMGIQKVKNEIAKYQNSLMQMLDETIQKQMEIKSFKKELQ